MDLTYFSKKNILYFVQYTLNVVLEFKPSQSVTKEVDCVKSTTEQTENKLFFLNRF
jgi:hypothetical protein